MIASNALRAGIAGCAIAAAASLTSVAPAQAAPLPVPAAPIHVQDLKEAPIFGGGFDLLALLNNKGTGTAFKGLGSGAHWTPGAHLVKIKTIIALVCYKAGGGHGA